MCHQTGSWNSARAPLTADGLCNENTIGYHDFNLSFIEGWSSFANITGLSETLVSVLEETILRATSALEFCVWQDGSIPPLGDSAVYRTKTVSRNKSRCFYESGFAVVKNDDLYLSILCGAPTETHKQVDDLSITLRFMKSRYHHRRRLVHIRSN